MYEAMERFRYPLTYALLEAWFGPPPFPTRLRDAVKRDLIECRSQR